MSTYSLSHLTDPVLLRELAAVVANDRATTATLLAHLAEVDARRLYAPAGYPSMYLYCIQELRLSEDSAFKRIRAARTARQYPAIFVALAEGRLHLTAVVLLTPYLTPPSRRSSASSKRTSSPRRRSRVPVSSARLRAIGTLQRTSSAPCGSAIAASTRS